MKRRQFVAGLSAAGIGLPVSAAFAANNANPAASAASAPGAAPAAVGASGASGASGTAAAQADVTANVADFVVRTTYDDLPADLIALGKKSILDALGLSLAGATREESGAIVHRYLRSLGLGRAEAGVSTASVFGTQLRVPPRFAAFANGVAIHADDFDDTQLAVNPTRVYGLLTHPSVTALPASLALAETQRRSGRDFMLAYHLGVEVETKIAEAIAPRHYEDGFHSTGTCGVFGSAVGTSKLRGFDAQRVREALGLAAAQSSGLRENFGTMTKPFQAGHASEGGVVASDLVALGWTAADNILEAKRGFFHAEGGGFDPAVMERLGAPWTFISPGVSIKPFPSGSLTHPGMTLLQQMIRANHVRAEDVEQLRVGASQQTLNTLIHHHPTTGLEGKFSMEFCTAILLVTGGEASLGDFQDDVVRRPDVQAMIRRVDFYNSPAADAAGLDKMRTIIDLRLKDGRTLSGQIDYGKGSPQDPASFDDVVDKFEGCARYAGFPAAKAARIIATVRDLEKLDDVGVLTGLLRGAA
ncbi:MmgE/PrpD family protein [Burkholderia sp. WAC0059]|uniref:MmgE/PrpD family protein n=1 Tax=Burkholderia sp. WAC0059 TaxID=2066022 RepID=UPI000C7F524D|nr:MmgE/PrpD family protein [Burkholderia sp. WAC0059]PLZ03519.1 MmgE/PrpD family protein [Burkholderia sp. WAC0059]